ncbi:AraC family transcriptional regulator [Sulfitobacter sp. S190]|uniref:helix-turn-helix domain-containing protein n=1 Tax=Sulfitobacter sp. S190 TaxID=2867022 RepID=UPI0021A44150|nr:AraC family transcriptional regulator [Sulfitobacter sp. S190]UWR22539.1 AraC family transcriptional regulator [Sulfitobacter sp. S190]
MGLQMCQSDTARGCGDYGSVYGALYNRFPQQTRTAGSMPLNLIRVDQQSHETADPAVEQIVFRLVLESDMSHSSVDCGNGRVTLSGRKGSFYLAPADAASYWEGQGDHQLLMLALPKLNVDRMMAGDGSGTSALSSLEPLYNRDIFNGAIPNLMNRIWDHSTQDGPGASLLVDGLFMTLLGTLAGLADSKSSAEDPGSVLPLDARRLVEVTDYVDANLDRTMALDELAAIAGLSMYHFSRCFKLATNTTPHMFVTARRIEASRALLARTDDGLADIAYACGFSSQAYFTTKFREHTGLTPGAYRAALCQ